MALGRPNQGPHLQRSAHRNLVLPQMSQFWPNLRPHVDDSRQSFRTLLGFRIPLGWIERGLALCSRQILAVVFRCVSRFGGSSAEWGAAQTRRLPRMIWATAFNVTAKRLGLRFELDLRDNVQRTLYFTGSYERRYLSLFRSCLRPGDTYVDVGAHVGIHAQVIAADLLPLGGHVIAFEPAPDTCAVLARTAEANGLTNLEVVALALGAQRDKAELRSDSVRFDKADSAVRSLYGSGESVGTIDIVAFDEWAATQNLSGVNLIKIDVEGGELGVLKGMAESIRAYRPRMIGIEIRDHLLAQSGNTEAELRQFLHALGYSPVLTADLAGNFIFVPRRAL